MAQILVVDDSEAVRNEVSGFLSGNGFTVSTAIDGKDGLEKLKKDKDIKLVITDVNMPNMDGLTMSEKIRSELNNQNVHILVLTTENDANMKQRGKAAKVKGWIVKPFSGPSALGPIRSLVGA
ncbi:MAG: response regulator [SAR324 cluster bacterium]|nr:response regulator [SAR324 cluster bacterium]